MIKVQDWIATIPDEDKHIGYVGENLSEQRTFLLCGEEWEKYVDWRFHLDMAFDPESITTRDSRQVVQTTRNRTDDTEENSERVEEVTTEETYTVTEEERLNYSLTDVAMLDKEVRQDGILLTWQVLRQHTLLPGKLWATIRATGLSGEKIKKSAIIVFEVDAAINALPAARPSISEFEEMETRMDNLLQDARWNLGVSNQYTYEAEQHKLAAEQHKNETAALAEQVEQDIRSVSEVAAQTEEHCAAAVRTAEAAEAARAQAQKCANDAAETFAEVERIENNVLNAVDRCSRYEVKCETYAQKLQQATQRIENASYRRVNVRDYGAVGDGVTDDRQAILDAFEAAKAMLPCEVYFPAGTYGISNGMYITMPFGSGGLRVCGAGRDITTIKYLDSFPKQGQNWYAFRLWFGKDANYQPIRPTTDEDWMHDISFTGLTVYDPDPCAKVLHPAKTGGTQKEETHGIDIMYCKRVTVTECKFITCGDECINLDSCHDAIVTNNYLVGCPGAGEGGGAIAICSGCDGVVVAGNIINGSAPDEVLADGTVIEKHSTGIEIEGMSGIVRNVLIANNVVLNVQGTGIGMYAGSAGCGVYNATITDNLIAGCNNGIDGNGEFPKEGITISGNHIADCRTLHNANGHGVYFNCGGIVNIAVRDNAVMDIDGKGVYLSCNGKDAVVEGNTIKNVGEQAVYVSGGGAYIRNCIISNTGVGNATSNAAIEGYTGAEIRVYGCRLSGVRQPKAIAHAAEIEDTYIEMVDADGNRVADGNTVQSDYLTRLVNCQLDGYVAIKKDNAIVQGVTLNCGQQYQPAIKVSANGVIVTGCQINHTKGNECIKENTGKNHNLFANNVVNSGITTVGAQSVAVNNIDTRVTA